MIRMRAIHVERHPQGPRLWVAGRRVHHGTTGCMILAAAVRWHRLAPLGALLALHDRHDWRDWLSVMHVTHQSSYPQ